MANGQRREGELLGEQYNAMLSAFIELPPEVRPTVMNLIADLSRLFPR